MSKQTLQLILPFKGDSSKPSKMKVGKIIVVEGLQGAGKTLFCKSYCHLQPDCLVLEEWVDPEFLANYIADMKTKATAFQFKAQSETYKRLLAAEKLALQGYTVFIDRGLVGNRCFAEVQTEAGFISPNDMQKYRDLCDEYSKSITSVKIETWLLTSSVEVCLKRIKNRNREGEAAYQADYLKKLDDMHQELLIPDRIIDVNREYELTPTGHLPRIYEAPVLVDV
ncbi:MAG: deoxynucleoside kinase [Candidatus Roizmanbacteria bacterium]